MSKNYGLINFANAEDMYPKYDMGDIGEGRYVREEIGAERIGASLYKLHPGKRIGFGHRHREAEELYVILGGSGRAKIDDAIIELAPMDALRVAPAAMREFEAGPEGIEVLATGMHVADDADTEFGWWSEP